MTLEEKCFYKAIQMINTNITYKGTDVFELTDLLVNLIKEKEYKETASDSKIDFNDEIVFIEEIGELETIDIGVSGDNLFYCNDILTKNSIGITYTVDLFLAIISDENLDKLGQIHFKQLKNRYNDPNFMRKFPVGVDKSRMKLFDLDEEQKAKAEEVLEGYNDDLEDNDDKHKENLKKFREYQKRNGKGFDKFS